MAIEVEGPDGSVVEFPDGTSHDVIKGAMAKHFGPPTKAMAPTDPVESKTNQMSTPEQYARSGVYGLTSGAEGLANLAGKIPGADQAKAAKLLELAQAGKDYFGVGAQDFKPASQITGDSNRPLSERIGYIPRSIVEMAGSAAVGGLVGGLPGAVATVGATEAGPTIDRVRQEDNTSPDQELTTGQKTRVAGKVGLDMLMAGIGGKATLGAAKPIMSTGFEGLKQAGKQTARAALTDAAAADASLTADKALIEGENPSLSDLAVGGLQGAIPGAAFRAPKELAGGVKARENILNSLDPQSRNRINERVQAEIAAGAKDPFRAAKDSLENELNYFKTNEGITSLTKDLEASSGHTDRTKINIENALDAVRRGDLVSRKTIEDLSATIGGTYHGDNLLRLLQDHQVLNEIGSRVNDGGIMGTGFGKAVTPFGKWPTAGLDLGAAATVLLGGTHIPYIGAVTPEAAAALLGAQGLGYLGGKLTDRATGASNVPELLNRVSGPDVGPEITSRPYQETASAARAQQDAARVSGLQTVAQQARAARDQAKTDRVLTKLGIDVGNAAQRNVQRSAKARQAESKKLMDEAAVSVRALNKRDDLQAGYEADVASEQQAKDQAMSRQADIMRRSQAVEERRLAEEAKAATEAQKERDASMARQALLMRNSQALEERQSAQAMRDARGSVRALQNRDAIEARGPAGRGQDMGVDANVPLPELISSDATNALRLARLKQVLEKQASTSETKRQNDVLANVRRQLDVMNRSQDASATDARLPLAVAKLKQQLEGQVETQGPETPEMFSSLEGTPTGKLLAQARATERFNKRQGAEKAAEDRKAKKAAEDAARAKADRKVFEASTKAREAERNADPNSYTFERHGVTVSIPKSAIDNPERYQVSFNDRMDARKDFLDGARDIVDTKADSKAIEGMLKRWTKVSNNPEHAKELWNSVVDKLKASDEAKDMLRNAFDDIRWTWETTQRN